MIKNLIKPAKREIMPKPTLSVEVVLQHEIPHLSDAIQFSSYLPVSPYVDSTIVKTPEVSFRGTLFSENRLLAEDYLLNFKKGKTDLATSIGVSSFGAPYVQNSLIARTLKYDDCELISLPDYTPIKAPFDSLIRCRRSSRSYTNKPMELKQLSTILFYAQGITANPTVGSETTPQSLGGMQAEMPLRTISSGGGLYVMDLYFFAKNVSGISDGIYHYLPEPHALRKINSLPPEFSFDSIAQLGEIDSKNANLFLVYVYKLFENSRKYGDAGMAYAFIECGAMAQNIHLASTAVQCGSCDIGGFFKQDIEKLIKIDGLSYHVVHSTLLGV